MARKLQIIYTLFCLWMLTGCQLQNSYSGMVVFSGVHSIGPEEIIQGECVITGGSVNLLPGSRVTGSIHLYGGTVKVEGNVDGDVLVLSGKLQVGSQAVIHGDLNQVGGELVIAEDVKILGNLNRPDPSDSLPSQPIQAGWLVTYFLGLSLLTGFSFICARFFPALIQNIDQAAVHYVLPSAALGLLAWVVGLSLLVLMAYTILLIPLTLMLFFAMLAATTFGAVPYAIRIGNWIGGKMKWNITLSKKAALGMVVLFNLVEFTRFVPILRAILPILLFTATFGAVLLTRFRLKRYEPPKFDIEE